MFHLFQTIAHKIAVAVTTVVFAVTGLFASAPTTTAPPLPAQNTQSQSEIDQLRKEVKALKDSQSGQKSAAPQPQSAPKQPASSHVGTSPAQGKTQVLTNAEIISKAKPAVVYIKTTNGSGSGMIIDSNGYILTNAHVIKDVDYAKITLYDGRFLDASVIGRNTLADLAILKIIDPFYSANLPTVSLGNSDDLTQGDSVFAFGYPFGIEGNVSFKEGTISRTINEENATYIETSAEIFPGNSGGPLVNRFGEVIGVNTAAYGRTTIIGQVGETIKLAIPINIAKQLIPDLKAGRNYTAPTVTSITVEHPLGSISNIVVTIKTDAHTTISMIYSILNVPQLYQDIKQRKLDSADLSKVTTFSIPFSVAWSQGTELTFSITATDVKGNTNKETEYYEVPIYKIPGIKSSSYSNPLEMK